MRIITKGTLQEFWQKYPDSKQELEYWHDRIKSSVYVTPNDVIRDNPRADVVGNRRIVFNICHNKYRLVALFRYNLQWVYVRFIGTHKEYDKIENIKDI